MSGSSASSEVRAIVEAAYEKQIDALALSAQFVSLEAGTADPQAVIAFLENVYRTHVKSPQIVALLYATSAPAATASMLDNLCEELGLVGRGPSHPQLLQTMLEHAGVQDQRLSALEEDAERDLRRLLSEPLMFGTLRETALSILLEVTSFEWTLARLGNPIAKALNTHAGMDWLALEWLTLHAELDVRHAEQGLSAAVAFVEFFGLDLEDLQTIVDLTFRQNVLLRRYFPAVGEWGVEGVSSG